MALPLVLGRAQKDDDEWGRGERRRHGVVGVQLEDRPVEFDDWGEQ